MFGNPIRNTGADIRDKRKDVKWFIKFQIVEFPVHSEPENEHQKHTGRENQARESIVR